jgi:hypothetical protein
LATSAIVLEAIALYLKLFGLLHCRRPGYIVEFRLPESAVGGDLLWAVENELAPGYNLPIGHTSDCIYRDLHK